MLITPHEMAQVAAADTGRLDLYAPIHKALRAFMADTLLALGRTDAEDGAALAGTLERLEALLVFCEHHIEHENAFMHPAIEARAPGHSATVASEHRQHQAHIDWLRQAADRVRHTAPGQRAAPLQALYRQLALFVADNFVHMHQEETDHNAILWAHYSDAELAALHDTLVASIPPAEMLVVLRWMVPNLPPAERAALMGDLQAHAPAPAFEAALDAIRPHLRTPEWHALTRALGLPAVPGLAC